MASQMMINGKPVSEDVAAEIEKLTGERDALKLSVGSRFAELQRRIEALEAGTVVRQSTQPRS